MKEKIENNSLPGKPEEERIDLFKKYNVPDEFRIHETKDINEIKRRRRLVDDFLLELYRDKKVMHFDHPHWKKFIRELEKLVFNEKGESLCGNNLNITEGLLSKMLEKGQINSIEKSMQFLVIMGADCDCEIIYNIGKNDGK